MSAVLEKSLAGLMTADEFFDSPYSEGFELINGEVVSKRSGFEIQMPTGAKHGAVTDALESRISYFVRENKLGKVFAAETGFILAEGTVRGIDISFVGDEKLAKFGVPESFFPSAPDLAVEVISPGNSVEEIQDKIAQYIAAGTKLVWIVYPKRKMVHVHSQSNIIKVLQETDELDGEDVLPNFKVRLSDIFE